jgi:hypothetical protein
LTYGRWRTPQSIKQNELRGIVAEALAYGASLLWPGAVAKDNDERLRQFI